MELLATIVFAPLRLALALTYFSLSTVEAPMAYVQSLTAEGKPVMEPVHIVSGPRYYSIKLDLPLTDRSLWYYTGDEVERCGMVDENTYTFRISDFGDTHCLDGHESGEDCFDRHMY